MHRKDRRGKVGSGKDFSASLTEGTDLWEQVAQLSPAVAPPRVVRTGGEEDPEAHSIEEARGVGPAEGAGAVETGPAGVGIR